jgi:hypothetical protein
MGNMTKIIISKNNKTIKVVITFIGVLIMNKT